MLISPYCPRGYYYPGTPGTYGPKTGPERRVTRHKFATHVLTNNTRTEISHYNDQLPGEPFPWPANRSKPDDFGFGVNLQPQSIVSHYDASGAAASWSLQLWPTDSSGADIYEVNNPPSPNLIQAFYGLYFKLVVISGGAASTFAVSVDLGEITYLQWDFWDSDNQPIPNA